MKQLTTHYEHFYSVEFTKERKKVELEKNRVEISNIGGSHIFAKDQRYIHGCSLYDYYHYYFLFFIFFTTF